MKAPEPEPLKDRPAEVDEAIRTLTLYFFQQGGQETIVFNVGAGTDTHVEIRLTRIA